MKKKDKKEIRNKKNKMLVKKLIRSINGGNRYYKHRNIKDIVSECNSIIMKCKSKNTFKRNKVIRIQKMVYKKIRNLNKNIDK